MESQAEASSSLCSVPYLRPHTDKANKKRNHDMYFPVELITNILARLPVKTLLRFRCVSTSWRDVIESEDLETMHVQLFNQLQKNACILARLDLDDGMENEQQWVFVRPDTLETITHIPMFTYRYDIEGYATGLVLLGRTISALGGPLILWNPSIRQHFVIPMNPSLRLSHALLVLGYDASKNDYKVVAMDFPMVVSDARVLVYSLRNRSWKSLSCSPPAMMTYAGNVHLRGQIYWMTYPYKPERYISFQSWRCVSFDVCKEVFSYVALPPTKIGIDVLSRFLFVLGESISLLDSYGTEIWIWDMGKKSNSKCWIKRSKVDLLESITDTSVAFYPFFLGRNGELLHGFERGIIVSYDINTRKRSRVFWKSQLCCEYVESLVLLRKEKDTQFSLKQPSLKQDEQVDKVTPVV